MKTLPVRSLLDGQRHQLLAHPFFTKTHSRDAADDDVERGMRDAFDEVVEVLR